ncbi:hypothetical protein JCM10213v2_006897 [Rhodosporidiobolus nylandii]
MDPREKSLKQLDALRAKFTDLVSSFRPPALSTLSFAPTASSSNPKLEFTSQNAPVHGYEEALTRLLTELDGVDSLGEEEIRQRRKGLVKEVEGELGKVEGMRGKAWRIAQGEEKDEEGAKVPPHAHPAPPPVPAVPSSSSAQIPPRPASAHLPHRPSRDPHLPTSTSTSTSHHQRASASPSPSRRERERAREPHFSASSSFSSNNPYAGDRWAPPPSSSHTSSRPSSRSRVPPNHRSRASAADDGAFDPSAFAGPGGSAWGSRAPPQGGYQGYGYGDGEGLQPPRRRRQ